MTHYAATICILLDVADDESLDNNIDTLHDDLNNLEDVTIQHWGYAVAAGDRCRWPDGYWHVIPEADLDPDDRGYDGWITPFVLTTRRPVARTHQ